MAKYYGGKSNQLGQAVYHKQFLSYLLMAKANSFKSEPWTALEKGQWSIFQDDFVHEKLFTLKATRKTSTSTISLKEALSQKEGKISSADELKFWFPFRGTRTLYGRIKNDGYKLHYDHGILTQNDIKYNFYGSVQGKRIISHPIYKIGVEIQNKDFVNNWRLRFNQAENAITLHSKLIYNQEKWSLGLVNAFQVLDRFWSYSAAQLSWRGENPNNQYYLRLHAGKKYELVKPKAFLDGAIFNFVHSLTPSTRLAVQLEGNFYPFVLNNAAVAWDHQCSDKPNTGIKVKADIKRNVSFSVKNSLNEYGSYIFGVHIHEFGGANRFSYGIQLDLTL